MLHTQLGGMTMKKPKPLQRRSKRIQKKEYKEIQGVYPQNDGEKYDTYFPTIKDWVDPRNRLSSVF